MKTIKKFFYFLLLFWPLSSGAESEVIQNLDNTAKGTGLIMDRTATGIIKTIINALLGMLGTVFIVLIILGGFRWMTSQGNKESIESAKKTITNATIGLMVVLASYMIARFVIGALVGASRRGGGTDGTS